MDTGDVFAVFALSIAALSFVVSYLAYRKSKKSEVFLRKRSWQMELTNYQNKRDHFYRILKHAYESYASSEKQLLEIAVTRAEWPEVDFDQPAGIWRSSKGTSLDGDSDYLYQFTQKIYPIEIRII